MVHRREGETRAGGEGCKLCARRALRARLEVFKSRSGAPRTLRNDGEVDHAGKDNAFTVRGIRRGSRFPAQAAPISSCGVGGASQASLNRPPAAHPSRISARVPCSRGGSIGRAGSTRDGAASVGFAAQGRSWGWRREAVAARGPGTGPVGRRRADVGVGPASSTTGASNLGDADGRMTSVVTARQDATKPALLQINLPPSPSAPPIALSSLSLPQIVSDRHLHPSACHPGPGLATRHGYTPDGVHHQPPGAISCGQPPKTRRSQQSPD